MYLFLGRVGCIIATSGPPAGGDPTSDWISYYAKCLCPKKLSLMESSKDISDLSSLFEHMNTILLLLTALELYGSI